MQRDVQASRDDTSVSTKSIAFFVGELQAHSHPLVFTNWHQSNTFGKCNVRDAGINPYPVAE